MTRDKRREEIRRLVGQGTVRTQNALVDTLRERGFDVTQATVSRDIADLNLVKDERGYYVLAEDLRLRTLAASAITRIGRAGNQVVVRTVPGSAMSVAAAIDDTDAEGVLGSIAGDDTILVICADDDAGARFQKAIEEFAG